ncbi:hypothetical protein JOB18_045594 [Solea senegalensis]|uniref:Uncharacterized protein n=1 Tax=Solea senegalensis TaxID=28829 RepID=A0AAV6SW88_SOLSE|nr:hypothetical protein JOB18_045594 [Solea senegalensis]
MLELHFSSATRPNYAQIHTAASPAKPPSTLSSAQVTKGSSSLCHRHHPTIAEVDFTACNPMGQSTFAAMVMEIQRIE